MTTTTNYADKNDQQQLDLCYQMLITTTTTNPPDQDDC